MDQFSNGSESTLASGITSGATSLSVAAGDGAARFSQATPFNAFVWDKTTYARWSLDPNREVVRVTVKATDTFTVDRGQEGTSAVAHNTAGKTYGIVAMPSAMTFASQLLNDAGTVDGAGAQSQVFASGVTVPAENGVVFNGGLFGLALGAISGGFWVTDQGTGLSLVQDMSLFSDARIVQWPDASGRVLLDSTATLPVSRHLAADATNATATFASLSDLSVDLDANTKYDGQVIVKCINSVAAEGIKFDFNGGSATATSFWAAGNQLVGGSDVLGTGIATSLSGAINFSTITGETVVTIVFSILTNAAGTFIPRFAENSHTAGTATVRLGTFINRTKVQ